MDKLKSLFPSSSLPSPQFYPKTHFNKAITTSLHILLHPNNVKEWSWNALKAWYTSDHDPMVPAFIGATALSVVVWVLGEVTGNVSQVDRLWTFLPLVYSFHFTFWPLLSSSANYATLFSSQSTMFERVQSLEPRMLLLFGLQTLWCIRLTTNTYRRGFFNPKSEDYRWEIVRAKIPVWQFKLMNLFFIAFIQNYLLLSTALPQYLLHTLPSSSSPALNIYDYALATLFVSILVTEMFADNQQQEYQWFKRGEVKSNETKEQKGSRERGFVTGGLWSWSRHPNFACEQSTFWVLYLFTVLPFLSTHTISLPSLSTLQSLPYTDPKALFSILSKSVKAQEGILWNYTIWAPFAMSCLFYASTDLTEKISAEKYPFYRQYQRRVGMFWPPITFVKGVWLALTGAKKAVEKDVWGVAHQEKVGEGRKKQ